MSRINGETSGFHSESFRRSIPSIGSCCVWNTNPTKNVPFVGFPVTIYFQCFWVWYCSLTLVLPLFGKESRFMQILYLVMTYTHTNHDEVPSGVCCDSFVLILMHFGLRSICCSRRWMWQVWAWFVIEAQKDCLRFLGATYKHVVILCTPVHSNLHTNILHISEVFSCSLKKNRLLAPFPGNWETGLFNPPLFKGLWLTTKATSTAETFWGVLTADGALGTLRMAY